MPFRLASHGPVVKWHGSPAYSNAVVNGVHVTRAIPLDYGLSNGPSVTDQNPLIYSGMQLGKNITLSFQNLGPVALYQTVVISPTSIPSATIEIPTAYLSSSFGNFFTFDGQSNALSNVAVPSACASGTNLSCSPPSGFGGVIISDASQEHALGVYGGAIAKGGSIGTPFGLWDFRNCGGTTKWNAVYSGPVGAGENI